MRFSDAIDAFTAEKAFRSVQNAYTASLSITARTIAINSPVVLATATASLPANPSTGASPFWPNSVRQNFVQNPATSTSLVNNLFLGILAAGVGTKAYLDANELGVAQCYGPYVGANIERRADTIGSSVGAVLIPELVGSGTGLLGVLLPMVGPQTVNAVSTATVSALPVEVPALGGLAIACAAIASSSATETNTAVVFLRCM